MASRPAPRRLTLRDLTVLVLAAGVAIGMVRDLVPRTGLEWTATVWARSPDRRPFATVELIEIGTAILAVALAPWAVALLVLRLMRPRPRLRRLIRQPGCAACVAFTVVMLADLVRSLGSAAVALLRGIRPDLWAGYPGWQPVAGFLVLGAWLVLWLGRLGRPEKNWLDRCGRGVGALAVLGAGTSFFLIPWLLAAVIEPAPAAPPPAPPATGPPAPPTVPGPLPLPGPPR